MSYFDKKEDVLDLKLTPYGRHLLSRGKLKPGYYAFLDDEIIYNVRLQTTGRSGSVGSHPRETTFPSEHNSEIKNRILHETPNLKPQYTMLSVETELEDSSIEKMNNTQETLSANIYDTQYRPVSDVNTKYLQNTIGTSKHGINKAPRWNTQFFLGKIDTTLSTNFTSSNPSNNVYDPSPSASVLHIPQLEIEVEWEMETKFTNGGDFEEDTIIANFSPNLEPLQIYQDGTYLNIVEDQILSRIEEINGFTRKESFDIQVFIYEKDESNNFTNTFKPLKFLNKTIADVANYKIEKDILIEEPFSTDLDPDDKTVEYYFDLRVDNEIPEKDICSALKSIDGTNPFIDELKIKCPDVDIEAGLSTKLPQGDACGDIDEIC